MNVYVIGAGVSWTVGYPLGGKLFSEVGKFFVESGGSAVKKWADLRNWLEANPNPGITKAFRMGHLEFIFTQLDLYESILAESRLRVFDAEDKGKDAVDRENRACQEFGHAITEAHNHRKTMLTALKDYLETRHRNDHGTFGNPKWKCLNQFAEKLCPGDVVISFNYDSTLERVLLNQSKWTPKDGYGFTTDFEKSAQHPNPSPYGSSRITVLHLHGAVGWYRKNKVANERLSPVQRREEEIYEATEQPIVLSPDFLKELGIKDVSASPPQRPTDGDGIFIYPSFLEYYEYGATFIQLWRKAAKALRRAKEIFIIGYSLPEADSGALSLLITNCNPKLVRVVNQDQAAFIRLCNLVGSGEDGQHESFEAWLAR